MEASAEAAVALRLRSGCVPTVRLKMIIGGRIVRFADCLWHDFGSVINNAVGDGMDDGPINSLGLLDSRVVYSMSWEISSCSMLAFGVSLVKFSS
jgi:hypothetical protein